ncbi:alginate lyase family protein [Neobacillus niacini]|uniref:alginate lyase family protein n=1 Tax=Neobacillus niacini TaxID=86668 RepID=UPI002FFEFE0E
MEVRKIFHLLDLDYPGLEKVKKAVSVGQYDAALKALKDYFVNREQPSLFFCQHEKEALIRYINDNYQDDVKQTVQTANQVANQTFVFQEAWDMERTNVPVTFDDFIQWDHVPYEDKEWAYMLNRHRFWIPLGQAYLLTGDETYAEVFSRQLEDWIIHNLIPKNYSVETLSWRSIEAGLRCGNWIKSFQYFQGSRFVSPELFARMLLSLYEHGEYIMAGFNKWKTTSNWGVIENTGLFQVSIFAPEFKESSEWKKVSLNRLKETARLQVMKDGIHWEQSPLYHNEVLLCYLDVIHLVQNNHLQIDKAIIETARKMAYADLYLAKPNHRQPMKGDSDNFDLRDILTIAAILFQDGILKFGGYNHIDYRNLWDFGLKGKSLYEQLRDATPPFNSYPFDYSGNFIMRSGWKEDDLYLYFHCGPLGGGHGHADMLHFDIHAYGKDLLTDLGRYNYSDSYELRKNLKQCSAHNTTHVDGIDFTEYVDTWSYGRVADPTATRWISEEHFDYVEASHNGYWHLEDPVHVKRRILFVKPCYWIVVDEFFCQKEHNFSQFFHFSPGKVQLDSKSKACSTIYENEANLHILPINSNVQAEIKEGSISYEYNLAEPNMSVTFQTQSTGFTSMMTVLYPAKPNENAVPFVQELEVFNFLGEVVNKDEAQACKISFSNSEEHIIVFCHRPPFHYQMSYDVDGTQIFNEVTVIKRIDGIEEIIVVK